MRRFASLLLALLLALGSGTAGTLATDPLPEGAVRTASGRVLPELPDVLAQPSVHAQMLAEHRGDAIEFERGGPPSVMLGADGRPQLAGAAAEPMSATSEQVATAGLPNGLRKQVFGFLPYWMLTDSALDDLNYHLVSTIAYFSVGASKDGYLVKGTTSNPSTGWAGWKSAAMTQVIDRAHASGVKVVLTVTMMAWNAASADRQAALLGSSTARSRLVRQIVSAIEARGADGVNLDFEPLATSLRDEYVSFTRQLKRGLRNAGVGANLTVCVMAGAATWATGYDVAGLTASGAADALFVMGYDYHWSGSSRAGAVAPIQSPYTLDVAGTMADFLTETSGSKLIWGVPYYGRTWPTTGSQLNATSLGYGSKAYTYTGHRAQAAQFGRRWDDVGKVPWYRYWDGAAGNWVQGYYDDRQSLGIKYDLINARGLAGTGMWTLLMDQGRNELWRLLANKFVHDMAPPVGGVRLLPSTVDAQAVRVSWRVLDYASDVSHYNVQYRRSNGDWRSWLSGTRKTAAWFAGNAGATYLFRVRAVDQRGNAQPWITVPAKPASLKVGAFARVRTSSLNVRTGPGTGYGLVATASKGDRVYLLDGPVAAGGYAWYRVQYGFTEWPAADFPLIAWVAGGGAGATYLAPSASPTSTRLAPFVTLTARTPRFSPNGDGVRDGVTVNYTLGGSASAVELDILSSAGTVVRSIAVGAQPAGANSATWNGRLGSGAWAGAGRYLVRVTAVEGSGASHSGPAATFSRVVLDRWASLADLTRPVASGTPRAGAEMVPAKVRTSVSFSERVSSLSAANVQLRVDGVPVAAQLLAGSDGRSATLVPAEPLPVGRRVRLWLSDQVRDAAGNPLTSGGWGFWVAPGVAYAPSRAGRMLAGSHKGYAIAQDGDLLRADAAWLSQARTLSVGQRATLPNLPGRWLLAESGRLAGRWLRESPRIRVKGEVERRSFAAGTALRVQPATHVGYRFEADGDVRATLRLDVRQRTTLTADARAVINGQPYWRLAAGRLNGYWVAESRLISRPGSIGRLSFGTPPLVELAPATHTGYEYNRRGTVQSSVSIRPTSRRVVTVAAWAVINGRPHYLVSSGALAGLWLPETGATRLRP